MKFVVIITIFAKSKTVSFKAVLRQTTLSTKQKLKEAIDTYLSSVKSLCSKVTEVELNCLKSGIAVTELKPKHFYLHSNSIQKEIGFLYSGLMRSFYIDNKGNKISVNFFLENSFATDYPAFITQTPCKYYFQCIEHTVIVNLSYKHIQEGYEKFPTLERYGRLVTEEVLKMQQRRRDRFLFDNAEKRYLNFINEYPDLFIRVSLSSCWRPRQQQQQSITCRERI
jgi:CRP/FNR family transcriptional regulator